MGFRTSSARRSSAQSTVASSIVVLPPIGGLGPTLSGGGITANTVVQTQIVQPGQTAAQSTSVVSGVKVTAVYVTDSNFNVLDDTALDPAGGFLKIVGTGFASGCSVYLNGESVTTTFISSTEVRVTTPANTVGTYNLMIFNTDGNGAIYLNLGVSNFPTFTTSAGSLGSVYETNEFTQSVSANGDAPLTYSLYSGSLPPGATLASNGVIYGTSTVEDASNTYSFVINVKDTQGQDTTRSFSLTINTDVVTWNSPANNSTISLDGNNIMTNVSLSATSAAGKTIIYTANSLPEGVLLSGNTIYGTPNTEQTVYTELTATSDTSNRTSKRYVSWSVSLGDAYFQYIALLLSSQTIQKANFAKDNSVNNFDISILGDTRPSNFNPYQEGYYSNYFDGTGDRITVPGNSAFVLPGDFTIELWVYPTTYGTYLPYAGQFYSLSNSVGSWLLASNSLGLHEFYYDGQSYTGFSGRSVSLNKWNHVALVRSGTTVTLYIDGQSAGTASISNSIGTSGSVLEIGGSAFNTSYGGIGHISNLRILKGTALYTTTFTPPTEPLTAITNTSILTCKSNRFIDNSVNNFTITQVGDAKVSSAHPFVSPTSTSGSAYFDGTGDYLTIPDSASFEIGLNVDFTVEAWFYSTTFSTYNDILTKGASGIYQPYYIFTNSSGNLLYYSSSSGGSWDIASGVSFGTTTLNRWYHVAVSRQGTNTRLFLNGVLINTIANSGAALYDNTRAVTIGARSDGTETFTGYISDVRIVKGTALYTDSFSPSQTSLTAVANTQLLTCQTNGGATNNGFVDQSVFNNIVTRYGNTTQGTFSPYGLNGWSNYFATSSYLSVPASSEFAFGTGAYTIEAWVYLSSLATYRTIFEVGTSVGPKLTVMATGALRLWNGADNYATTAAGVISENTWYHIAWVRESTSLLKLYVNGTSVLSVTTGAVVITNLTGTPTVNIGFFTGYGHYMIGYISNLRIVKGTALYTTTFTPTTSPLNAISGTSLLTCRDNRFVDKSPNNFAITTTGDVSAQIFSAFRGTQYSPSVNGGSMYFDGTGDTLSVSGSTVSFGTSPYTIEFWINRTAAPSITRLFERGTDSTDFSMDLGTNGTITINNNSGIAGSTSSLSVPLKVWTHVALVRANTSTNGTSWYFNGVPAGSFTHSTNVAAGGTLYIASSGGSSYYLTGYLSDLKITKGAALYSGAFNPPVEPLTPTTTIGANTYSSSLLLNGTNAGIVDAHGGLIIETADNVRLSPNGFYFDGSGDYLQTKLISSLNSRYTIEMFIKMNTLAERVLAFFGTFGSDSNRLQITVRATGRIDLFEDPAGGAGIYYPQSADGVISANTLYHVAATYDGTTARLFVDGNLVASSTYTSTSRYTATGCFIGYGRASSTDRYFPGYISDVRITRGYARYTSNFTVPSSPLKVK